MSTARSQIRKLIAEEVQNVRSEIAAERTGKMSRRALRSIIMEEAARARGLIPMSETRDVVRTPKYSLVRALLGEADEKAKLPSFSQDGKDKVKVGAHSYHVFNGDPTREIYLPELNSKVANKVTVRPPHVFGAFFLPRGPMTMGAIDFARDKFESVGGATDVSYPLTFERLMENLSEGIDIQYVMLKNRDDVIALISPAHLAKLREMLTPDEQGYGETGDGTE